MDESFVDSLICPSCGSGLWPGDTSLACSQCSQRFDVVQGVPMLLPGLRIVAGAEPDAGFVEDIARLAAPYGEAAAHAPMRELFSKTFLFADSRLGSEGHRFLHRLRASGFTVRDPHPGKAQEPDERPGVAASGSQVELALSTVPRAVRAGQEFWVQIRLRNGGATTLQATGPAATVLSCAPKPSFLWSKLGFARRQEPRASNLLVDVPSGGELTQPVHMVAASRPGLATYRIVLLGPDGPLPNAPPLEFKLTVVAASAPDPLAVDWPYDPLIRDYGADRDHGSRLLAPWLEARLGRLASPRVLELGGNASPIIQQESLGLQHARKFNLDIDPFGLVFGTVQRRLSSNVDVQDVLGDGMRLPFADGSVDAIVMFATLHHFPDPAGLLRHLATKLAPNGLICACCEPVGHVTHEHIPGAFREELLSGICEQAFEPWEWRSLFERAGLTVAHVQHDRGSLKVALERG